MSELENKIPQEQRSDGTVLGALFYLGGVLLFLVSFLSILSQVTGWKLSMKGVPIPAGWGFAGIFSALALASFGTGWVYNLPSVQRVFRNHKWIWFPLLGGIVAFFWGLVVVINILDAGGLLMYAVNQGNVKKVEGS